jgi:localization factor PodJL
MSNADRWRIPDVSKDARALAREAAQRAGVGVGDWLDTVIRRRTGLEVAPDAPATTVLPADLIATLDAIEARVAAQADSAETLVAPLAQTVDRLDARIRSAADSMPPDSGNSEPGAPFYADDTPLSDADRKFVESTVAADLGQLFDDGVHAGESDSGDPVARPIPAPPPRNRENPGRRGMTVAAAIVVVLLAVAATLYQWTQAPTAPAPLAPTATTRPAPVADAMPAPVIPAPPVTSTPTAPPTATPPVPPAARSAAVVAPAEPPLAAPVEKVELETLPVPQAAKANGAAADKADPSFVRPPAPALPEGNPVAALYRDAAAGDARAQYDLAVSYIQGQTVPQDHAAAAYWLRAAATAGLAPAQYNLGVMYDLGLAGVRDPVEALLWFHAAAEQGHARAFYALGLASAEGKGVPRNPEGARLWFTRGAEAGVVDSQFALGLIYDQGLGSPADASKAYYWYRRAEIAGNPRAGDRIAGLASRLNTAERAALNDQVSRAVTPSLSKPAPQRTVMPATASGAATAARPASAATTPALATRETIRAVQALLTSLGFDPGPADGDAGPRTQTAIADYQRALDLPVDGRPSAALLAHLRQVTGQSAAN